MSNSLARSELITTIDTAFNQRDQWSAHDAPADIRNAVDQAMAGLNDGSLRVASNDSGLAGDWTVHEWLKKAVLLYFKLHENTPTDGGYTQYFDKVPLKYDGYTAADFARDGVRVVPPATVRHGVHIAPGAVLMPSYVNIGAFVGGGSMVDTWATVGSCAQIGRNVHLSGGVGIGGVLEPLQATPTIIEDECFIGARSEVVEGVVVERGSVLSMGVFIGQSTPIYNRETGETTFGRVPAGSVVVPGSLPKDGGRYSLTCAVIVKTVDDKTRSKVGINELLREAAAE